MSSSFHFSLISSEQASPSQSIPRSISFSLSRNPFSILPQLPMCTTNFFSVMFFSAKKSSSMRVLNHRYRIQSSTMHAFKIVATFGAFHCINDCIENGGDEEGLTYPMGRSANVSGKLNCKFPKTPFGGLKIERPL